MKWLSTELVGEECDMFRDFLKLNNIKYEVSDCSPDSITKMSHFEVYVDDIMQKACNDFIDSMTYGFGENL